MEPDIIRERAGFRDSSSATKRFATNIHSSEAGHRRKHIHRPGWRVIRFFLCCGRDAIVCDQDATSESECCRIEGIGEDGILCSILSQMTLRDAMRTSVLSSRWRNLWKDNPIVEFSARNMLEADPAVGPSFLDLTRSEQELILVPRAYRFVHSVNHMLRHRPSVGVKHFIVEFRLIKRHTPYINRWLRFAIESGAKLIHLNLFENAFQDCSTEELYDFPCQLFNSGRGSSSSLEILQLCYCIFRLPEQFAGFASLTKLFINRCHSLVTLDISPPSGRLEFLSVYDCRLLKQIELSGISLQMFYYSGCGVPFTFKNAVRIVGLWLYMDDYSGNYCLTDLPRDFPHLDNLIFYVGGPIEASRIPASYKFAHLRRLDIFLNSTYKDDFITLACILNAAPLVEMFHLNASRIPASYKFAHLRRLDIFLNSTYKDDFITLACILNAAPLVEMFHLNLVCQTMGYDPGMRMRPMKYIHKHLKQLKICGFSGAHEEIEFVLGVVQSAIVLEMIILDPYYKFYEEGSERVLRRLASPAERSRERARKFLTGNIGDIELVIL